MKLQNTKLQGVKLITPDIFRDHRGEYCETFNYRDYRKAGVSCKFVQDDISVSKKGVLRGIHGDDQTWKLVQCLHGSFYLAVINWDENSPDFRKCIAFTLDDVKRQQVLIPPQFGNGHYVLSDYATFHYKQSTYYGDTRQFTIKWDSVGIDWPLKGTPIMSRRDNREEWSYNDPGYWSW